MDYRISGERLKGFADQARRLGKVGGELTPGQIEEVLRGVTGGAALPSIHPLLIAVDVKPTILPKFVVNDINIVVDASPNVFATVEDVTPPATLSGPKCYYNDVLLPGIPAEMFVEYPYAWIREDKTNGNYDIVFAKQPWYFETGMKFPEISSEFSHYYSIPISTAESATEWVYTKSGTFGYYTINDNRTVMWSNHDIPNGSATATEIYFEGSEPVLAE